MSTHTAFNYIGGEWISSSSGEVEASLNPSAKGEIVGWVQSSGTDDLNAAVLAAREAQPIWRKLAAPARGEYLFKAAAALERRLDEVAETMAREMGKTLPEAKGETARGVAILRYYAGEGMRKTGDVIPSTDSEALMLTTRVPLGVVGVITPWNFPIAIPLWKMAPALIYGNTVVLKPATETAVTAVKLMECLAEAGFPAGTVNLVTGKGSVVGQAMAEHPFIQGITFTGSNQTGKRIGMAALARGAKYQLEMGGKNPLIVAADADLDQAVEAAVNGGFRSTGQKCTATSRVIIANDIFEPFVSKLLARTEELKVGSALASDTWMGPCASEQQYNNVASYIRQGVEEGAVLLHGGGKPEGLDQEGYYIEPAIFDQVDASMAIAREEIFGPVLALLRFDTIEEALAIANDTEFGLSASIFTQNIAHMLSFIQDMDAGLIRINSESAGVELQAPFGGMKQSSSHSREQGQAAIEFFTSIKTVFIKS
ncbi:alpha-ketoglutaric semialdehyde dehydrogenase GucD [Paenibacillus algorifonticola]|uniref:alpha-ketoglutaric semialdehyde dehydrogenase GucD n=1 Tax=Paenibacillus algorifonticola TaxID=684063 RepID=UPI003D2E2C17